MDWLERILEGKIIGVVREILKIALFIVSYISKWLAVPFRDRDL